MTGGSAWPLSWRPGSPLIDSVTGPRAMRRPRARSQSSAVASRRATTSSIIDRIEAAEQADAFFAERIDLGGNAPDRAVVPARNPEGGLAVGEERALPRVDEFAALDVERCHVSGHSPDKYAAAAG